MPPLKGHGSKPCEQCVNKNRESQSFGATDPISDPTKDRASQSPSDEECTLNPGCFLDDLSWVWGHVVVSEQGGNKRPGDQGVEKPV